MILGEVGIENVANLGVAGLMGAMWLWERRASAGRDRELSEAHGRIMQDKVGVEQIVSVVKQNAEAMSRLSAVQEQLLRELGERRAA